MRTRTTTHRCTLENLEHRTLLSNYFVSPSGADTNPGTAEAPWKTLQKAATVAPQEGQAEWDDGIRVGGTPGNWVKGNIIQNNTVHMRVVDQSATPDQLGIFTSWNDGTLVQDNVVSGGWDAGIYMSNSAKNY